MQIEHVSSSILVPRLAFRPAAQTLEFLLCLRVGRLGSTGEKASIQFQALEYLTGSGQNGQLRMQAQSSQQRRGLGFDCETENVFEATRIDSYVQQNCPAFAIWHCEDASPGQDHRIQQFCPNRLEGSVAAGSVNDRVKLRLQPYRTSYDIEREVGSRCPAIGNNSFQQALKSARQIQCSSDSSEWVQVGMDEHILPG